MGLAKGLHTPNRKELRNCSVWAPIVQYMGPKKGHQKCSGWSREWSRKMQCLGSTNYRNEASQKPKRC